MEIMTQTPAKPAATIEKGGVLALFDEFERAGRSSTPSWIQALHKGGIAHFAELGFPTTQHEEWRFTNVAPIARMQFRLPETEGRAPREKDLEQFFFPELGEKRVVLVDGKFSAALSSKDLGSAQGLRVISLEEAAKSSSSLIPQHLARHARYDENSFAALNTAFVTDGVVLVVSPGTVVKEPIHILYLSTGATPNALITPRTLLIAERDSQIKVIEHYASLSDGVGLTNAVTEIVLEEAAVVEHCKIQAESQKHYHIATIQTHQGRSSTLVSHSISIGAALARNNINCVLDGEGIECTLNGLYVGNNSQLVDHHTSIFHNKPHCNSHEYYHGILDGKAQGVFNGKIFVRPEAQKTDAKQTNRNLLLSDEATVDTKPQLEIFADDVKCTHGATVGQLDAESIFYLRARGIGLESARKMLLHAFASEIVNRITLEPIRERLDRELFQMYER
jgi:Fe-S cluster assembly protein SufD